MMILNILLEEEEEVSLVERQRRDCSSRYDVRVNSNYKDVWDSTYPCPKRVLFYGK